MADVDNTRNFYERLIDVPNPVATNVRAQTVAATLARRRPLLGRTARWLIAVPTIVVAIAIVFLQFTLARSDHPKPVKPSQSVSTMAPDVATSPSASALSSRSHGP